ncbi:MAG: YhcH/YjgK/YiaL family protein [Planctomycetota bacterium]
MILDQLDSALMYAGLGERIATALALLNEDSVRSAAAGKHEVQGDDIFYVVNEYETGAIEDGQLEVHRKYMDIQYIVSGEECIGYAPLEGLTEESPYESENDAAFYKANNAMSRLHLKQGMFAIFWPNEPHMPGRIAEKRGKVKKIVVKIRME